MSINDIGTSKDVPLARKGDVDMAECSKCAGPLNGHSKYGVCKRTPDCLKENMRLQSAAARARNPAGYSDHSRLSRDRILGPRPNCKLCNLPTSRGSLTGICTRPTCYQASKAAQHDRERDQEFARGDWKGRLPVGSRFTYWTTYDIPYRETMESPTGRRYSVVLVNCRCDCGTVSAVNANGLLNGGSRSCGCKGRASRTWLREQKVAAGKCVDCGLACDETNYFCFDWDHRPGSDKIINVAHLISATLEVAKAEIAKCDLRCANCHRIVTHGRGRTDLKSA